VTPFGTRIRQMRRQRGISQRDMAAALGVSAAYLSAFEHGHRGRPSWALVQKIIGYFNVIWDEADELQRLAGLSDPRVTIDTSGMPESATRLANMLAADIGSLSEEDIEVVTGVLADRLASVRTAS
jgi:transcriptional regulator with XRE-family HTH domain